MPANRSATLVGSTFWRVSLVVAPPMPASDNQSCALPVRLPASEAYSGSRSTSLTRQTTVPMTSTSRMA